MSATKESVRRELHEALDEFLDRASELELEHVTADAVKSTLEKTVSRQQMYQERFGTFYSTARVLEKLGKSRQAVHQAVRDGRILRVTTRDGKFVYPAFQFSGEEVIADISKLVSILHDGGMDGWSILYWLTNPWPDFGGETPVSLVLQADDRVGQVTDFARIDAAQWVGVGA